MLDSIRIKSKAGAEFSASCSPLPQIYTSYVKKLKSPGYCNSSPRKKQLVSDQEQEHRQRIKTPDVIACLLH